MSWSLLSWTPVVVCLLVASKHWWARRMPRSVRRLSDLPWRWYLIAGPAVIIRMRWTWRRLCRVADLSVSEHSTSAVVGRDLVVSGRALRPVVPRLGVPRIMRNAVVVRVHLHPGQTPERFIATADALAHAWRVHSVRVVAHRRGEVEITAVARDPLTALDDVPPRPEVETLSAVVGKIEDGVAWVINLRHIPHWLIIGATRSGKSNLLSAIVAELAPQRVAILGIDLKGGLELTPVQRRLSALACTRPEALTLLDELITEAQTRMAQCRRAGVRNVWELPEKIRPVPVVTLVDEIAELYLTDGSRASRDEAAACSTALLRLAQLGGALGLHLVVSAQRLGSELGPGVTALRAQLGGRVCHSVHDAQTAEMGLGDLATDAVAVALAISPHEQGVAITSSGGSWHRVRSVLRTTAEVRRVADKTAHLTPLLPGLLRALGTTGGKS
jgi:S-DNA-T family DNA segregation ATPase FtsK/SpoIIIE